MLSSSTLAGPAPRKRPTSTWRSDPGTDVLWLAALARTRSSPTAMPTSAPSRVCVAGFDGLAPQYCVRSRPKPLPRTRGIAPDVTRRIASELSAAPSAAVYGRIGTHTVRFGTVAVVARRRAQPHHRQSRPTRRRDVPEPGARTGGGRSRARRPRLPHRTLAEPGNGPARRSAAKPPPACWPKRSTRPVPSQIRALVTVAGRSRPVDPGKRSGSTPPWAPSISWSRSTST